MAEAPVMQFTSADLQELLKAVVREMKEPTPAEKAKAAAEHEALRKQFEQAASLAKTEEEMKAKRWDACPHFEVFAGRKRHKWVGQVNSDGYVVPICNMCFVEAPKFSAKLLPEGGREGVRFSEWNDASKVVLLKLHAASFPQGCGKHGCPGCTGK